MLRDDGVRRDAVQRERRGPESRSPPVTRPPPQWRRAYVRGGSPAERARQSTQLRIESDQTPRPILSLSTTHTTHPPHTRSLQLHPKNQSPVLLFAQRQGSALGRTKALLEPVGKGGHSLSCSRHGRNVISPHSLSFVRLFRRLLAVYSFVNTDLSLSLVCPFRRPFLFEPYTHPYSVSLEGVYSESTDRQIQTDRHTTHTPHTHALHPEQGRQGRRQTRRPQPVKQHHHRRRRPSLRQLPRQTQMELHRNQWRRGACRGSRRAHVLLQDC